ncbi:hypothetical protein DEU56DRAFT_946282 [Suillus clintonianus]|uniref:uncharacterized protein n=1 Tax=Suillus clintonianus TaxID=1904413 RepID=UPI001B87C517|nr:uncharacterized protein DEU56DRAFT_946282 [Suillus clintonianus]KAG2136997.1 hypothetical protein DEU56DRAFT_946282 [Suillus clintonianus]
MKLGGVFNEEIQMASAQIRSRISITMQRTGSAKLLPQPVCRRGRERTIHALSIAQNPLSDAHPNMFALNLLTHALLNTSGPQSPLVDTHHLEEFLLFERFKDAHLHVTHVVPLVQHLHIDNNHLSKSDIHALHHRVHSLLFGAHLDQSLLQVAVTRSPPLVDALRHALHLTLLWLQKTLVDLATANGRLLSGVRHRYVPAELKKIIISITKRAYDIFPQGSAMRKEEVQKQVTAAATRLLKSGDYLRLPDSSSGQFMNFTAQALRDACLEFYYSNSKKALKNTNKFHRTIPINVMLLVAAVLKGVISGFQETGTDKVPVLTTEQCRTHFVNLRKSVDMLLDIPERRCGERLKSEGARRRAGTREADVMNARNTRAVRKGRNARVSPSKGKVAMQALRVLRRKGSG